MRIRTILPLFSILALTLAGSACSAGVPKVTPDQRLTIEVDGMIVTLESGVNVRPEIFQAALNPEFVANNDWVLVDGYWDARPIGVSIPLEAEQLILPDGHPEFPANTSWVIVESDMLPIEVPVPLAVPASWLDKYSVRTEGNSAFYDFVLDPARPAKIFSITALTEAEWQAIQNEPHGEAIFSYGGMVWVYNPALENPYDGEEADLFSQMVGEAHGIAKGLAGYFTPQIERETALPVLQAYFDALRSANYTEAANMFGGDLELLAGYNPDIASSDTVALFERACTVNGFICNLEIGQILDAEQISVREVQFILTFQNPDGSPFELGSCCGEDAPNTGAQQEFPFTVAWQDGRFRVMELPVYVP